MKLRENLGLSEELGVLYTTNSRQGEVWREPYTAHYYFRQIRKKIQLEKSGTYRIFIWPLEGQKGDYVFEFGDEEIWPIKDILYTLWVYPKLLLEREIATENCTTSDMK